MVGLRGGGAGPKWGGKVRRRGGGGRRRRGEVGGRGECGRGWVIWGGGALKALLEGCRTGTGAGGGRGIREIVRVVLRGVGRVGVYAEATVNDGDGGVGIDLAGLGGSGAGGDARLRGDVSDGAVEGRVNELGIVLVQYLFADDRVVLVLLDEVRVETVKLEAKERTQENGFGDRDAGARIQRCKR